MRFVLEFSLLFAFAIVVNNAVPIDSGYMVPHPGPAHPRMLYDPALIEELYERGLLEEQPSIEEGAENERPKRRWWGNKYKDNKSYGFWITALNKAGNWKKRSYPDY